MDVRALSPVIGLVALLGLIAIAAVSLFVVGTALTDSMQSSAEEEQAERSMTQFAETADRIALGEATRGTYTIRGVEEGSQVIDADAGHVEFWLENASTRRTLIDEPLGEVRYRTSEGTIFAFQGGGVWRADGDGAVRVIRAPAFQYRTEDEPTITFRHLTVSEVPDGGLTHEGTIAERRRVARYPTATDGNPVDTGIVYAEIESRYCTGWQSFFQRTTDSAIDETCGQSGSTDVGEVRVEFSVPFTIDGLEEPGLFDSSVSSDTTSAISGPYDDTGHDMPSASLLVERKIDQATQDGAPLPNDAATTTETVGAGLYHASDVRGNYTFDTSSGDVQVAVDGSLYPNMDNKDAISITGGGNVTFFARDDSFTATGAGGTTFGNSGSPEQLRVFLHSDADVGTTNFNSGFYGILYAPNSDVDLQSSSMLFEGALVADSLAAHKNSDVVLDTDASDVDLRFELGGAPFYYLHVTNTDLAVEES